MKKMFLAVFVAVTLVMAPAGCATIFYPYRVEQNQTSHGGVDVLMLVLDIVFGVIPLVVDLVDGAIYFPTMRR